MNREPPPEPARESGFLPTRPPPEPNLELALLLVRLGIKTLQVLLIDLPARACEKRWNINELGKTALADDDGSFDPSFPTAMGSLAQLEHTPPAGVLSRQLGPRLWAFAWRIDAHRVAVAEAYFRLAHVGFPDAETNVLRKICEAGLQVESAVAEYAGSQAAAHPAPGGGAALQPVHDSAAPPVDERRDGSAVERRAGSGAPLRAGLVALMVLCLAAAAILVAGLRGIESSEREVLRLRGQADAVMSMRLGEVLRGGDYGEVQAELDAFAALKYFERALVTNAQHRVIAAVGAFDGVRIGNGVPGSVLSGARVVALSGAGQQMSGPELVLWDAGTTRASAWLSPRVRMIGGLVLSLVAAAAAAWLLLRESRRSTRRRA